MRIRCAVQSELHCGTDEDYIYARREQHGKSFERPLTIFTNTNLRSGFFGRGSHAKRRRRDTYYRLE